MKRRVVADLWMIIAAFQLIADRRYSPACDSATLTYAAPH
jgi:hypothetical protein